MNAGSVNWRIYAPLVAVVGALLGAVVAVLLIERNLDLGEAREQDRMAVRRLMSSTVAQRNGTMQGVLAGILANRRSRPRSGRATVRACSR